MIGISCWVTKSDESLPFFTFSRHFLSSLFHPFDHFEDYVQPKPAALHEPHLPRALGRAARGRAEFPAPYCARRFEVALLEFGQRCSDEFPGDSLVEQLLPDAPAAEPGPPRVDHLLGDPLLRQPAAPRQLIQKAFEFIRILGMGCELALQFRPRMLAGREKPQRPRAQTSERLFSPRLSAVRH